LGVCRSCSRERRHVPRPTSAPPTLCAFDSSGRIVEHADILCGLMTLLIAVGKVDFAPGALNSVITWWTRSNRPLDRLQRAMDNPRAPSPAAARYVPLCQVLSNCSANEAEGFKEQAAVGRWPLAFLRSATLLPFLSPLDLTVDLFLLPLVWWTRSNRPLDRLQRAMDNPSLTPYPTPSSLWSSDRRRTLNQPINDRAEVAGFSQV
jgi:hypothetical protein